MTRLVYRVRRRLRQPDHIGWGGDYTDWYVFTPTWEPSVRGEIR